MLQLIDSKISGLIKVKSFLGQKSVWVGGVEQSGPLVKSAWERAFCNVAIEQCNRVLILGLGCGVLAKLISQKFPGAKITGIEIDPVIVDIGKKYFSLDAIRDLRIIIGDARKIKLRERFDLILVDLYHGPTGVNISKKKLPLSKNGMAIINYLDQKYKNTFSVVKFKGKDA